MAAESPIVAEFLREERPPLQCRWNALPKAVRDAIGSERQWISLYHKHSLLHQHEYDPYVSSDEAAYLEEMLRSSRERCMLYPYHLAADLSRLKQHTPFEYYLEMMYETIRQEKSYDTIPNFTAADCMRLLRVGRNEFLHAMNNCRSKGWMWKRRRALILRQMPARPPDDLPVEHWWHVWATDAAPGLLEAAARGRAATWSLAAASKRMSLSATTAPIEAASSVEASVGGGGRSGEASASTSSMKGPPIEDDDEGAETPRREGTLSLLERDALQALLAAGGVKRAGEMERGALAELYAAGAVRYHVPVEEDDRLAVPPLKGFVMNRVGHDYMEKLLYEIFVSTDESTAVSQLASLLGQPLPRVKRAVAVAVRLGFAKNIAAPPLAPSAVKGHPSPWHSSWLHVAAATASPEAGSGSVAVGGGEAVDAAGEAALGLEADAEGDGEGLAVAGGGGAAAGRVALLVDSKLSACLMMSNLATELKQHAVTLYEVGKIPHESLDAFLAAAADVERPPLHEIEVLEYFDHAIALRDAVTALRRGRALDIVRSESLHALQPATRSRVLRRSYAALVSMAPMVSMAEVLYTADLAPSELAVSLPSSPSSRDWARPHHMGPAAPSLLSPWLALCVYETLGRGPPSLLLRRGTRMLQLPRALAASSQLLLTPWRAAEPTVVRGCAALATLAEMLTLSPVLVQPYPASDADVTRVPFPVAAAESVDAVPHTAEAIDPVARAQAEAVQRAFGLAHSFGFVKLMRPPPLAPTALASAGGGDEWVPLGLNFGLPLFDVPLSAAVCAAIDSRALLSEESLAEHRAAAAALLARVAALTARYSSSASSAPGLRSAADATEVPYPTQDLLFDGATLRALEEEELLTM